ncbi:DUF421 domain-containing protein [Pediococcus pentosaceus]|uniref:DUF421 domain-containing protein n=1 Tax=Lactobacillaceae TaxID=33958 RepID=UPI0018A14B2F|nr:MULTISPECIES: YetF domain-containing protein [Lactobacillaceae]MBF7140594.1 DUF421 domain-containing protein [Pediococcus pentosaceus]MCB5233534.1 DUF421 domain-containing protein [Levilactobacillus brevis]MCW6101367.1 DUF421 domain-containing protein [Lactiplantibacillus plantarum]MCW6104494.1 DUF421 domain-containing protein [Lactiplantibacillus plantarum]MDV7758693.1 DUF421 domain-containing protein [Liquorilactobacillus mali]
MLFSIALKLIVGLLGLLVVVRLLGKKAISEITPFDLIYTLVLGGILEESIYDDKVNIGHLLFALFLWATMIYIIERVVQKNEKINRWLKGEPSVLIRDGVLNLKEISGNHIEMEQLRTMLRQQQCFSLENAKHTVLENAGQISVLKKSEEDKVMSLMLVDQGRIQYRVLQTHELEKSWLMENLEKEGYTMLRDILYVEWSEEKGFYILTNDDVINTTYRIDG